MQPQELFDKIRMAVVEGKEDEAVKLARQVVEEGVNPTEAMDNGFLKGVQEVGRLYQEGRYFLSDLVATADTMRSAMEIIQPELDKLAFSQEAKGTIIIATVQGDIHDIGKTIVASMLRSAGFDVFDLGYDVPNDVILSTVEDENAEILALSALLTTTMSEQENLINLLKKAGLRNKVKVIVGGAPVSKEWAEKIGADAYGENAIEAVEIVKSLMEGNYRFPDEE